MANYASPLLLAEQAFQMGANPRDILGLMGGQSEQFGKEVPPVMGDWVPAGAEFDPPSVPEARDIQEATQGATQGTNMAGLFDIPFRSDSDILSGPTARLTDWMEQRAPEGDLFTQIAKNGLFGDDPLAPGKDARGGRWEAPDPAALPPSPFHSDTTGFLANEPQGPDERSFKDKLADTAEGLGSLLPDVRINGEEVTARDMLGMDDSAVEPAQVLEEIQAGGKPIPTPEWMKGNSKKLATQVAADLPPEAKSGWDKFNDEYDLTAIGMALLATNDGSNNMSVNIGKAMMMGKAAKERQKDAEVKTAEDLREEGRAERKVKVEESNAWSSRIKAIKTGMSANGMEWQDANPTYVSAANGALAQLGVDEDEVEGWEDAKNDIAAMIRTEMKYNPGSDRQEVSRRLTEQYIKTQRSPGAAGGWFGSDYVY